MTSKEARDRAKRIVERVRINGSKNDVSEEYTDAQIWQAVLDASSADPKAVTIQILSHVIEGREPPSCVYMEVDE